MALDLLALVDVETTGLNPATDEVIELGCILYSLSHNCVLQQISTLVPVSCAGENPTQHINGISKSSANALKTERALMKAFDLIEEDLSEADALVAHNAPFDRSFLDTCLPGYKEKPWIDTRAITWPRAHRQGCSLVELALAYEIPVWGNHRALADCQLLANIIQREPAAAQLLTKELEPKEWVLASQVSKSSEDVRAQAKELGFVWEGGDGQCPGFFAKRVNINDISALPKCIGPTTTSLTDWLWCSVECTKQDQHIHSLAKNGGFDLTSRDTPWPTSGCGLCQGTLHGGSERRQDCQSKCWMLLTHAHRPICRAVLWSGADVHDSFCKFSLVRMKLRDWLWLPLALAMALLWLALGWDKEPTKD